MLTSRQFIINQMSYVLHIDGLVQDCSNSIANALKLPQSCTKASMCDNHN